MSIVGAIPSQYELFQKLIVYARLKDLPNVQHLLDKGGYCSGLSGLFAYYYSTNQVEQYLDFLRRLKKWNGKADALDAKFSKEIKHYMNDLEFMHEPMQIIPSLGQRNLKGILDVIGSKNFRENWTVDTLLHLDYVFDKTQLFDLISALKFNASIEGKVIDFSGYNHSIAVFYQDDMFCIYDPNKTKIIQKESISELVDTLANCLFTPDHEAYIPISINVNHIRQKIIPRDEPPSFSTIKKMHESTDGLLRTSKLEGVNYSAFSLAVRNHDLLSLQNLIQSYKQSEPIEKTPAQQKKYLQMMASTLAFAIKHGREIFIRPLLNELDSFDIDEDMYMALSNIDPSLKDQLLEKGKLSMNAKLLIWLQNNESDEFLLHKLDHVSQLSGKFSTEIFKLCNKRSSDVVTKALSEKYPLHHIYYRYNKGTSTEMLLSDINHIKEEFDAKMVLELGKIAIKTKDGKMLEALSKKFPDIIRFAIDDAMNTFKMRIFDNDPDSKQNLLFMLENTASLPPKSKLDIVYAHDLVKNQELHQAVLKAGYIQALSKTHILNLIKQSSDFFWLESIFNTLDEESIIELLPNMKGKTIDKETKIHILNMAEQKPNVIEWMINHSYLDNVPASYLSNLSAKIITNEACCNPIFLKKVVKNETLVQQLLTSNLSARYHNAIIAHRAQLPDLPLDVLMLKKLKEPVLDGVKNNLCIFSLRKNNLECFKYILENHSPDEAFLGKVTMIIKKQQEPMKTDFYKVIARPLSSSNKENAKRDIVKTNVISSDILPARHKNIKK